MDAENIAHHPNLMRLSRIIWLGAALLTVAFVQGCSSPDASSLIEVSGPNATVPGDLPPVAEGPPASRSPASVVPVSYLPDVRKFGVVKLYFATDRTWTGKREQPKWFDDTWNGHTGHLTYGKCFVTIPVKAHQTGAVEKPSIFRWELNEDPERHVIVRQPFRLEHDSFFQALQQEVQRRSEKEIVIFIHGFNNTFDDAASRLGVLAYDMPFNGVPVLYSWCSTGGSSGTVNYLHDEEIIKETVRPMTDFINEVAIRGRMAGAKRISIVAHSMGNRALMGALESLAAQHKSTNLFDEAVMAAPDIAEVGFATDEWPLMQGPAKRLTLYASKDDRALLASYKVHGFRRIGEAGNGILLIPGLDTVDASGCDFTTFGLNHSYFGGSKVLTDLALLTLKGYSPKQRKLSPVQINDQGYWTFPKP